jgi:SAM-dependent methyltransferase
VTDLDCLHLYEDAAFYDLEFAAREHEIPFYRRWCARAKGPILEVACGTGRLTLPLAQEGYDIVGLDFSSPMLERARQKSARLGLKVAWMHQDCRTMELDRRFALIFCATNAMQHLLDAESVDGFLGAARRHLLPGGLLLIDVFNPNPKKLMRTAAEKYLQKTFKDAESRTIEVEAASSYCADLQQLRFTLTYRRDGQEVKRKQVTMRCFFPEELLALCRHNGLEVAQRFGDYDERTFGADAPKQILVCREIAGRPSFAGAQ